jgi:hypothetical protein
MNRQYYFRRKYMKNTSTKKAQTFFRKFATIGAFIAIGAIFFSGCEAVTGSDGDLSAGVLSRSASRAAVGQPTPITDQQDLADIELAPAGDYILANDITVTGWTPICDPTAGAFTGSLDGDGYTITVNSFDSGAVSGSQYLGIFATSDAGARFSDLTVNVAAGIVSTTNVQYVGGLVAQATGTNFDGITVTGTLDVAATSTSDDTAFSVGLVAGAAAAGSTFIDTTIEASLNVLYNNNTENTTTNRVYAGGIAGYLTDSKAGQVEVDGKFTVEADMPYYADYTVTPLVDNWAALGAVAGYAENAGFNHVTIDASTAVDAVSENTQVYVAGVVGRGQNVTIEHNESAALVSGNGPNYTTSAGGVAGYIVQSTVRRSSASGDVNLGATWDGSEYDVWQIYAGGLVGYAGGNDADGSVIEHSHATGNVTVNAPYPYAGGLVGYNYGYVVFTSAEARRDYYRGKTVGASETSNGSKIIRSYATGNAAASSTPGSNGLPYAGGLAGYSSIPTADTENPDPNIENCYATGNATVTTDSAYGWAGGLLGANAQGSIVSKTYATGNVFVTVGANDLPYPQPGINPGAAGGGIAGVNYYTDVSSGFDPLVEHSVALNKLIYGTVTTGSTPYLLHRVVGDLGDPAQGYGLGTLDDNLANRYMLVSPVWNQDIGLDKLDGDDTDAKPPTGVFTSLGWDFSDIWTMGGDGYPVLQ